MVLWRGEEESKRHVVRWHAAVYKTSDEASDAASKKMAKNPGLSYFCQGFDRLLKINEYGISEGFMAE